mmetsp:Transcript_11324/g.23187  ORF Transcript_11324/g.23187 Transcript_11324/m.23187 type:complete len:252 (-) Transcript_11324:330-1085(-)
MGFLLKHFNKMSSNNLSFLFWFGHSFEQTHEFVRRVDTAKIDPTILTHAFQNIDRLILSQATIVNQDSMESISNSTRHQYSSNGRIDPSRHGSNHMPLWSHLGSHLFNEFIGIIRHNPIGFGSRNFDAKVFQNVLSQWRMCHFGVKLETPHFGFGVFNGDKFRIFCGGHKLESVWHFLYFIPVRHPHLKFLRHTFEQNRVASFCSVYHGLSIFMLGSRFDDTSKHVGNLLHSIADPQNRNVPFLDQIPRFF